MSSESNIRTRKSIVESVRKLKVPEIGINISRKVANVSPIVPRILTPLYSISENSITSSSKPSCTPTFSPVGRFSNSIYEKFKSIGYLVRPFQLAKLSDEEKSALTKRIKINQNMNQHLPSQRIQKVQKQHKTYEAQKMINQSLKKQKIEEKTRYFKELIESKFRRYEIRKYKSVNSI